MTGALNHMLAQQHQQELMRAAEEERRGASLHAEPRTSRRMLDSLRRWRRRGDVSGGESNPHGAVSLLTRDDFVLDDGGSVRIRPLRRADRAIYEQAVAGLSPRSRYLRFAAPIPKMSERLLDQMMQVDDHRHVVYAALTSDESTIVGVVRYVRTADNPQSAEVAIAVADDWQGRGLGRELLGWVVEHARLADLDSLIATTLSENRAAAGLAGATGFSVAERVGIYTEYEMRLNSVARGSG